MSAPPSARSAVVRRPADMARRVYGSVLALALVVGILIGGALHVLHGQALKDDHAQSEALLGVLEEQTTRSLQAAEGAMRVANAQLEDARQAGWLDVVRARGILRASLHGLPFVRAMWVLDPDGRIQYDSDFNVGADLSDRDYFRTFVDGARQTFIGRPLRSRSVGTWFVALSQPLYADDGRLLGVMVASIEPPYFDRLWRTVGLAENGVIGLVRDDGVLLVRAPHMDSAMGRQVRKGRFLDAWKQQPQGHFYGPDSFDGAQRHFVYRALSAYPSLALVVGRAGSLPLEHWRTLAWGAAAFWTASVALLFLLAHLLSREFDRRARLQQRLTAIYEGAPVCLAVVDSELRYVVVNERQGALNGLPADLHPGRAVHELAPNAERHYREVLETGRPIDHVETSAGDRHWLMSFHPVLDRNGKVSAVTSSTLDLTAQRRSEHAREELEAQLRQAQKLEAIGLLTGGIAHDFNNLLTVILGNAERLLHALPAPAGEHQPLAQGIHAAATRGAQLVQRLLAFARRQTLEPRDTDVGALLREVDPMLRRTLPDSLEIELHIDADLWNARVDPVQLESALLNLSINARDAMPGGGRLTLAACNVTVPPGRDTEVAPGAAAGDYVMVSVSDTGQGIAPEHIERVFEPFFTTKPGGKGTGLGLPMVHGFVKQSGGHIDIRSTPGAGTSMRLLLPRGSFPVIETEPPLPLLPLGLASGRLLILDDDETVGHVLKATAMSVGVEARCCTTPLEFFECLSTWRPTHLAIDLHMPHVSGLEVLRQLGAAGTDATVIMQSGAESSELQTAVDLAEGLGLRVAGALSKPYSTEVVRRLLDR